MKDNLRPLFHAPLCIELFALNSQLRFIFQFSYLEDEFFWFWRWSGASWQRGDSQ